ncbi:MAG: DNA-directed polymerase subunit alpha [Patescibacteria group bacterium]|jgi:DNA-directed RNA polymerase subunit alpha|nr:DNA-directed polymerase subunit alpha [Patescibacteria group bacterium]
MIDTKIILPSKPRLVKEEGNKGVYEIDNLYPGYGHTLGNSLRRIILSSLPGASITSIKISGADHEFAVLDGVKEDVINIILNLKKVRFRLLTDEVQTLTLKVKGPKEVYASDIKSAGQVEVLTGDQYICEVTGKIDFEIEMNIQKGLGYVSKEELQKEKMDIGHIALDAIFTPIRRVAYDVENMRVGDSTNYNRLIMSIETDGTYSPREAIEKAIEIMIVQLQAIHDFKGLDEKPEEIIEAVEKEVNEVREASKDGSDDEKEIMKTRIEDLNLSTRTLNSLINGKIRTVGGIARKTESDLLELEGMGEKGIQEIKRALSNFGILLK